MVKAMALAALLALTACQTGKGSFCDIARPIRLSDQAIDAMTDAEVEAALSLNEKGRKLCGWKPQ